VKNIRADERIRVAFPAFEPNGNPLPLLSLVIDYLFIDLLQANVGKC
jgi:hypothetical protein